MAIEVVGKDESIKKQVTCHGCGSILKYLPKDRKQRKSYDYTGDYDIVNYITCPECSRQISV